MSEVTLAQAKLHLRVDQDVEDDAIQVMIEAAELHAANYLNAPEGLLDEMFEDGAPQPVISAVLLLVGDLYANRESQTERALLRNDTFYRLLDPYRLMEA